MFLLISTHFTATPAIPLSSPALKNLSFGGNSSVKRKAFTADLKLHLHALYAQSIRTTLASSVLPAAGTELAEASSTGTVIYSSLSTEVYDPKAFIPHAASLHQAFAHCAEFPLATSRRSLGRV